MESLLNDKNINEGVHESEFTNYVPQLRFCMLWCFTQARDVTLNFSQDTMTWKNDTVYGRCTLAVRAQY